MKKREEKPLYTVSVSELLQKGNSVTNALERDLAHMSTYGYSAASVQKLRDLRQVLSEQPTDDEFVGLLVEKTQAKDELADSLRAQIGGVVARATTFYGAGSGKVRRYGADGLAKMTDGQLWQCAKRTARVGTAQLPDLMAKGLKAAHLTDLSATAQAFDAARDAQDDAVRERDIAAQERVGAANKYYQELQTTCADGQSCLGALGEAQANDYVWDPTPEPAPGDDTGGVKG